MIGPVRLEPVPMSVALLEDLERRGLILRLAPGHHRLPVADGESAFRSLYESDERWGPHKLIAVTVDRRMTARLDVHPDNEEFLLIGDPAARPLYLVIALAAGPEL
ncbi:MAG: hypothetical protein ACXVZO_05895, partial [Gaiellaceae bacterium]